MQEVQIPRYIDSPWQIFFWEFDEFIMATFLFAIGIMSGMLTLSILVIYFASGFFKSFKRGVLDGALLHLIYWVGILPLNKENIDGILRRKVF